MKRLVAIALTLLLSVEASAQQGDSLLDRWNNAMATAAKATGAIKEKGVVRTVTRGASPEIVLRDDELVFDGKALKLGQLLRDWDKVLPGKRRCEGKDVIRACVWDSIGLRVSMQFKDPKKISSVRIYLALPDPEGYTIILPERAFAGYVELDGFGIDARTRFWEVRQSARQDRDIRCGLRECVSPHGALGVDTSIYFGLSEFSENGAITAIELGGDVN